MKKKGIFITIEGPDGCGKSTHSKKLCQYLTGKGYSALHTREPGGTVIAEALRRILLNPKNKISPLSELFMYEASRVQHMQELILPALYKGKIVISERFYDATVAYQGYGRGLDIRMVKKLNHIATGGISPDFTIIMDIDAKEGLKKAGAVSKDRLERENIRFHKRVREGYLKIAKLEAGRIKVIKVRKKIKDTQAVIRSEVDGFLKAGIRRRREKSEIF